MADVLAFRAYRYHLGRVGDLSDVIAPPYDVIDSGLQDRLYDRSPFNVIRLILNREEPGDGATESRYVRAAGFLRDWRREGILIRDSARAFYVCHQEFELDGHRYTRRGFMARVRLERIGAGKIFPHEQTLAGPREDRLKLFHATRMNLSPVFGLYPDEKGDAQALLDGAVGRTLPLEATDHLGVVSRLWPVTDQGVVSAVTGLMGPRAVFLADGHHRYETALCYRDELSQVGVPIDAEAAPNFVLMMLVRMNDPGLLILPTHRLARGLPGLTAETLRNCLAGSFDLEMIGQGPASGRLGWERIQAEGGQSLLAFGTAADGLWQTARFRKPKLMERLAPDHTPAWRALGVSILHVGVLGHLLPEELGCHPECAYVHLLREVEAPLARKECDLAVLVPPATMEQVQEIAAGLEKMPAKSTYFYPKLLSGLVFNPLNET